MTSYARYHTPGTYAAIFVNGTQLFGLRNLNHLLFICMHVYVHLTGIIHIYTLSTRKYIGYWFYPKPNIIKLWKCQYENIKMYRTKSTLLGLYQIYLYNVLPPLLNIRCLSFWEKNQHIRCIAIYRQFYPSKKESQFGMMDINIVYKSLT